MHEVAVDVTKYRRNWHSRSAILTDAVQSDTIMVCRGDGICATVENDMSWTDLSGLSG